MAQGFLGGLLWGGVAGVGLLAVSTQVIERQDLVASAAGSTGQPEATEVEVPAGTEFDQARPATDPEIPAEETRPGGEAISGVSPPADLGTTPPAFDTAALEMPQPVQAPGSLGELPTPAEDATVDVTGPGEGAPQIAPVEPLTAPEDAAIAPQTDSAAPQIATPAETEAPEVEATEGAPEETTPETPELAGEPASGASAPQTDAPSAPESPEAPAAMTAPEAPGVAEAPTIARDEAPVAPLAEDTPTRPQASAPREAEAPLEIGDAPEAPDAPGTDMASLVEDQPEVAEPPVVADTPLDEPPAETPDSEMAVEDAPDASDVPEAPSEDVVADETPVAEPDVAEAMEETPGREAPFGAIDEAPEQMLVEAEEEPVEPEIAEPAPEMAETDEVETPEAPVVIAEAEPEEGETPEAPIEMAQTETEGETDPVAEMPRVRPAPGEGGSLPRVIRLIGEEEPVAEAEPEIVPEVEVDPNAGALERFRVASDVGPGDAILSLVILHEGGLPDAARVNALPRGLSFAVDAGAPDAEAVAAAYRAAGREVVLIPSLPERARPQDVEQAMQANLNAVPEAVAVMDTTGGGFQSDREAVAQVVDAIGATGHGLITFPRGLNTAHQRAEREGVPRGLIFRDIDGSGEGMDEIGRSLDRAAFRARQSRQPVILVGRSLDDTLAAVANWAAEKGGDGVILAPVSAALLAGS